MEKSILFSTDGKDLNKVAQKLHNQFGHPSDARLIKMIINAGIQNKDLERKIVDVSKNCRTCQKFKKPVPRPVVSIPLANNFNEVIAIDLKSYENQYFLVIVDIFTKYCAAALINNKKPETIVENMFSSWITIFGAPQKILHDNGGEFGNKYFLEFAEAFNVKLMATAAESAWSNGVVERLNAVLGSSVDKIICQNKCSVKVALSWAVSARNALCTYTGFSPNQLVFGFNPALPNFANNKLPAMGGCLASDVVRTNLVAMHAAREEFVKMESNAKLQKAFSSNMRQTDAADIDIGDEVFYKRNESNEWKGPA